MTGSGGLPVELASKGGTRLLIARAEFPWRFGEGFSPGWVVLGPRFRAYVHECGCAATACTVRHQLGVSPNGCMRQCHGVFGGRHIEHLRLLVHDLLRSYDAPMHRPVPASRAGRAPSKAESRWCQLGSEINFLDVHPDPDRRTPGGERWIVERRGAIWSLGPTRGSVWVLPDDGGSAVEVLPTGGGNYWIPRTPDVPWGRSRPTDPAVWGGHDDR